MLGNFSKLLKSIIIVAVLATSIVGCSSKKTDPNALSEADLTAMREGRFGEGTIPTAEGEGMFKDIYFGYDSSAVDEMGQQNIQYNVEVLKSNPSVKVQIEGHCDERGTADYNLALGSQRAKSVQDMLVTYGIEMSRIEIVSYGEEVPLDPGHSEEAFAKNRRAHFSVFSQN